MAPLIASCVGEEIRSDHDNSIVPWWSITKTALAACALLLAADGRLELDRAVAGRKYTLRHLLQHTSGLGCYTDTADYEAAVHSRAEPWSGEQHIRFAGGAASFEPGGGWKYSNSGYFLVRSMVEQATGMDIERALRSLVLAPLGIERSFVAHTRADLRRSVFGDEAGFHPGWVAHGLLMGPPSDVVGFMHRLFSGALLPAPLLAAMRARHPVETELSGRPWRTAGYGLGLMIDVASPHGVCIGHSGQGPASVSAAYHFPGLSPPITVAAFAPTDQQGVAERAVLEEAARLR